MTTSPAGLSALLEPAQVAGLSLPNRFALAPMTRLQAPGGVPAEEAVTYYRDRAAGGAGLIITEGTLIDDPVAGFSHRIPVAFGDEAAAGWRAVVDAVHAEGSAIVPQLWHTGIQRGWPRKHHPELLPLSPSGIGLDGRPSVSPDGRTAQPATTEQIEALVQAYADAAAFAQACGFDGVEIHGAHGYLLDEFLWSVTNRRADRYGYAHRRGTTAPADVVAAIRAATGPGFPIIYRFSQWKADQYDARLAQTPDELGEVLGPLVEAGVDVFHPSTRRHWQPAFEDVDPTTSLAGWTKRVTGKPVIAVGSVGIDSQFNVADMTAGAQSTERLHLLEEQFERGEMDLVAVGRAMLADAAWVTKTAAGQGVTRYERPAPGGERTY